jgi:release factor glutamine methyltransferase
MTNRVDETLRAMRTRLGAAADAEALLAHALRRDRGWLFAHGDLSLDEHQLARIEGLVRRREAGEPVAYLTGRRGFWRLDLQVGPATLIPRPETELLVELALERLPADRDLDLADLGTGTGAIALSLALERPRARIDATDASEAALQVARTNAAELGAAAARVRFHRGDWWGPLAGRCYDLVVSNPPYIAEGDPHLSRGDLRFEPRSALAAGHDGLAAIAAIVQGAPGRLVPGGWLLLEHGHDQGSAVRELLAAAGLADVATVRDLEGRERATLARRPG